VWGCGGGLVACCLICGKCQCSRAGHALRRFVPRCSSLFGVVALESRVIANSKLETETRNPGNRNRKSESEVESRKSKGERRKVLVAPGSIKNQGSS
jgi:hypothetical protein